MHEEIVRARKELKLSQAEFAKKSGISRTQLRRLEEGLSVTTTTLAKAFEHLPNLQVVHFHGVEMVSNDQRAEAREVLAQIAASAQGIADAANRLLALIPSSQAAGSGERVETELLDDIRELDAEVDALRSSGSNH